jgi:hypothetical protein
MFIFISWFHYVSLCFKLEEAVYNMVLTMFYHIYQQHLGTFGGSTRKTRMDFGIFVRFCGTNDTVAPWTEAWKEP